MLNKKINTLIVVSLIFILALLRFVLIDYANFAPIAAAGVFGIYFLKQKQHAIYFALTAFFLSDIILQTTKGYGLYIERVVDYGGLFIGLLFALWILSKKQTFLRATFSVVVGSVLFFLVSNFGVWLFGNMYEKTIFGLLTCYEMGLPFYRGTLIGDLFFTTFFIGAFELFISYQGNTIKEY